MDNPDPVPFRYPAAEITCHGPAGYVDYNSYRPFLRDEFNFRSAYCLLRERWGRVTGEFDLDHFSPQAHSVSLAAEYENLVYSCHACNLRKSDRVLPGSPHSLTEITIHVSPDGRLHGASEEVEELILLFNLNSPNTVRWRVIWMEIIAMARERSAELYQNLMGYPDDLPDSSALKPPKNSKPGGIAESHFALRAPGELPDIY